MMREHREPIVDRDKEMVPTVLLRAIFGLVAACFLIAVYATMYVRDHQRPAFHEAVDLYAHEVLSFAGACWRERIYAAEAQGAVVGFTLLAALTALALLEHWLMVLPLPDEKLWRWMLPAPKQKTLTTTSEDAHGL